MPIRTPAIALLVLFSLPYSFDAQAAIYKCVDADGGITYSQTPCKTDPKTVQAVTLQSGSAAEAVDCRFANRFAYETARSMKNGASSSEIFNRYGGLDSLSKGTINLINYVYSHRSNEGVSAQRIAGLTEAKCQARSLGDVACEDLPLSFTDANDLCDVEEEESESGQAPADTPPGETQTEAAMPILNQPASLGEADAGSNARECKEKYQEQIDKLDAQMRTGYSSAQGDAFREQRRSLRDQLRQC